MVHSEPPNWALEVGCISNYFPAYTRVLCLVNMWVRKSLASWGESMVSWVGISRSPCQSRTLVISHCAGPRLAPQVWMVRLSVFLLLRWFPHLEALSFLL